MTKHETDPFSCLIPAGRRQRKPRKRGELFRLRTRQLGDMLGIVALESVVPRALDGSWSKGDGFEGPLIYLYKHTVTDLTSLKIDNFAIRPKLIFTDGWTRGVFETLDHLDDDQYERFKIHCFGPLNPDAGARRNYFDETGKWLAGPTDYVIGFGVCSVFFLDQIIEQYIDRVQGGKGPWF